MSPRGLLLILAVATPILGNSLLKRTIHADGSRDFTIVKHIQKNTCSCSCKCVPDSVAEQWLSDRHEPVNKLVDDAPESSAVLEAILGPSSKTEKSPEAVAQNIEKTLSHLTPDKRKPEVAATGAAQQRPMKNSVADFDATAPLAHRGGSRVQGVKNLNPVDTTSSSSTVTPSTTPASSSNSGSDADWTDDQETKDSLASLNKEAANSEATDVTNVASSNSDKPNPTLKVTIHPAAEPTVTVRVIEESKSETTTAKLAENIDQHVEATEQKNEDLPTTKPALPDTETTVADTTKVTEKTEPETTPLATTTVEHTTMPQKDVETTQATPTTSKAVATTDVPEDEVRTTARGADLLTSSGMFRTSPRELPPRWKSLMDRLKIKLEELKARKLAEAEAKKQSELTAAKALVLGVEPTTLASTTQQSTTTVSTSTVTQATTPKLVPATSEVAKTGDEAPSGLGRLILEDNSFQASGSKIVTVDPVATEATTIMVTPGAAESTTKPEAAASTVAPGASEANKKPAAETTAAPGASGPTKKPKTSETIVTGASSSSVAPVTSTTQEAPKTQASEATTLTLGLTTNAPKDAQASESSGTTRIDLTTTKLDGTTTPTTVGDSDLTTTTTTVLPSVAPTAGDVRQAAGATTPTVAPVSDVTPTAAVTPKEPATETTKKSAIPVTVATVTTTEKRSETSTNAPNNATTNAATTVAPETSRSTDTQTSAVPSTAKTSTTQAPTTPKTTVAQNNDATVSTKNSETTTTTGSGLEIAFKTAPAEESTQNSKDAGETTVKPIVVFPKKGKKAKEQELKKNKKQQGLEIASVSEEDEPKEKEVKKQSVKNQQKVKQQQQKKGKKNNKNDDEEYEVIPSEEDLDDEDEESAEEVKQKRPAFKNYHRYKRETIHAHDDGNGDEKPRPEHVKPGKAAPKQKQKN
ncbi:unnamed protein product, partial [Mesorhabditis spiculigera]